MREATERLERARRDQVDALEQELNLKEQQIASMDLLHKQELDRVKREHSLSTFELEKAHIAELGRETEKLQSQLEESRNDNLLLLKKVNEL